MVAKAIWVVLVFAVLGWHQEAGAQPARQQGTSGPTPSAPRVLTEEQIAKVKAVLSPYNASTLTVGDAKTIKRALRDAGMRPSPELDAALRAQGFSPERLDELDPRPPGPPGAGEAAGKGREQGTRPSAPTGGATR